MMLKLMIIPLILGCFCAKAMENINGTELIDVCSRKSSVELALTIENIKGKLNGADWEICCGRKTKEHKRLVKLLGTSRAQLIALENEKQNIDKLDRLELSSPHVVLMYAGKNLNSLHGFQGIEPFVLKNITNIDLSDNKLEIFPLPFVIESCPKLQKLNVSHNKLAHCVYRSHRPPHDIATSTTLTTLNLSHNNLTKIDFAALYTALPYIENLDLSSNKELASYTYPPDIFWYQKTAGTWPCLNVKDTSLKNDQIARLRTLYKDNVIEIVQRRSGIHRMGVACGGSAATAAFTAGMFIPNIPIGLLSSVACMVGIWGLFLGDDIKKAYVLPRLVEEHLLEAVALSEKNVVSDEGVEKELDEQINTDV